MNQDEITQRGVTPNGIHWYEKRGHRFVDLDHEKNAPRTGTKYVLPIRGDKFNELSFRAFRDHNYGIWFGIPVAFDRDNNPKFQKIKILAARYYDMAVPMDRKEFIIVQHHESVRGSYYAKGKSFLRVEDPEVQAENKSKTILEAVEPIQLAAQLHGKKLKDFARVMGVEVGNNSERIILGGLLEKAQKDPKGFMEKWNDDRRAIYEVVHRAMDLGLVREHIGKGFMWKEAIPLGNTLANVAARLRENPDQLSLLTIETEDALAEMGKPSLPAQVQATSETAAEKQLRLMKEENELLKKKLQMASDMGSQETAEVTETPEVPQEPKEEAIPMFEDRPVTGERTDTNVWTRKQLLARGVELGVDKNELKKIMSKSDMVSYINANMPRMAQPSEDDYDGPIEESYMDTETF